MLLFPKSNLLQFVLRYGLGDCAMTDAGWQVNTSNSDLKERRIEAVKVPYTTDFTDSGSDEDEDSGKGFCKCRF